MSRSGDTVSATQASTKKSSGESALVRRGRVSEVTREYGSRLAMSKIAAHSTAFSYASQDCRAIADTGTKGQERGGKALTGE